MGQVAVMDRLDCFNLASATVLRKLLENFPQPVMLDSRPLQQELVAVHSACDFQTHSHGNLVDWTIRFLIDEGFVYTSGENRGPAFANCRLTARGFAALNQKLSSLEPGPTPARTLLDTGRLFGPEVAGAVIGSVLAAWANK
jgi:hypothetical protein